MSGSVTMLVMGGTSFVFYAFMDTITHRIRQRLAMLSEVVIVFPNSPYTCDQCLFGIKRFLSQFLLDNSPHILDRIKIWRIWRPLSHWNIMVRQKLSCELGFMTWGIVMLESELPLRELQSSCRQKMILKGINILCCSHCSLTYGERSWSFTWETWPYHNPLSVSSPSGCMHLTNFLQASSANPLIVRLGTST